ncbi:MAG: hypothetical protein WBE46_05750 [Dehalococcoidia bacterium]
MVIRRLSKGESRLLNWNRCGVLSALSFIDDNGVRCFGREGLSKASTAFRKRQGNVDWTKKRAEAGG